MLDPTLIRGGSGFVAGVAVAAGHDIVSTYKEMFPKAGEELDEGEATTNAHFSPGDYFAYGCAGGLIGTSL